MIAFVCLFLLAALQKGSARIKCYTCTIEQGVIYNNSGDVVPYCLQEMCLSQCVVAVLEPESNVLTEYRLCYAKVPDINGAVSSYENVCNYVGSLKGEDCTRRDILFCDDQPLCNVADMPTRKAISTEPPTTSAQEKKLKTSLVIGGSVGGIVVLLVVATVVLVIIRRKRPNDGRIAAAEARIVSVIHPFEVNEYMTMEEIEELEQTK